MRLLVNLDVPDLAAAEIAYREAFGLRPGRRFGDAAIEMLGAPAPLYLLHKPEASTGAPGSQRRYTRHWTPLHLDVVVEDVEAALARAETAGFRREGDVRDEPWGRIVQVADPFGHGWCLLQFVGIGYDAITTSRNDGAG